MRPSFFLPAALSSAFVLATACTGESTCDADADCAAAPTAGQGGSGGQGGEGGAGPVLDCPASGFFHGPWSLHIDATSATVRWDACAPSSAELTLTPASGGPSTTVTGTQTAAEVQTSYTIVQGVTPDIPGTYYTTEVVLDGLEPGTCYRYDLAVEPGRGGRFCTARPAGTPFTFLTIGDTNPALGSTADTLAQALVFEPDFTVHTGDLQYYASVFESWAAWFPLMAPMLEQGGFYPTIGNHEVEENPYEYDDYYVRLFGGAGFDGTVERYRFESGGVWFFTINTEEDDNPGSEQAAWLEASIEDAAAQPGYRFSVLYVHRPWITLADYSQNTDAREYFQPIFLDNGVKFVLQGHVHGYERFEVDGVTYITTGGGGAALHDMDVKAAERPEEAAMRVAGEAIHHSVVFDVGLSEVTATAISDEGSIVDSASYPIP